MLIRRQSSCCKDYRGEAASECTCIRASTRASMSSSTSVAGNPNNGSTNSPNQLALTARAQHPSIPHTLMLIDLLVLPKVTYINWASLLQGNHPTSCDPNTLWSNPPTSQPPLPLQQPPPRDAATAASSPQCAAVVALTMPSHAPADSHPTHASATSIPFHLHPTQLPNLQANLPGTVLHQSCPATDLCWQHSVYCLPQHLQLGWSPSLWTETRGSVNRGTVNQGRRKGKLLE